MKKTKSQRSGVKTLQAAEPPYSVSNGPIKTNSEKIGTWRMIYIIALHISILSIVQRKEKGVDSRISCTRRIVEFMTALHTPPLHYGHTQAKDN